MTTMKDRNMHPIDAGDLPEDVLVSLMKAGETRAYKYFFWEFCDYVNLLSHSLLPSQAEDAAAVTQQIMQEVWTKRNTSWLKAPLRPFLYQEVYRKCQPYLDQKKRPLIARLFGM